MPLFEEDTPGSDIYGGYIRATKIAPITRTKAAEIQKFYGIVPGSSIGRTSQQVTDHAAAAVIGKFKATKAAAAPAPSAPTAAPRIVSKYTIAMRDPNYQLTQTDINRVLIQSGLGGTQPPDYARVSVSEFYAWVERQVRRRAAARTAAAAAMIVAR